MSGAFDAGTASARLTLDLGEWSANIEKARADSKSLGATVAAQKDEIEKIGKAFTAAGVAIVGALGMAVKSAMDFTLEAGRMSDKTGIAVETISGLREAADDAEVTMQDLSGGFRRYSAVVADAAGGNKMAQESLKKLGVEIFDSSGKLKTMDQLLLDAADRFSKMENGIEKAALAQDLFGRGGAALIPLFNKGAEGIKAYTEDVRKSGQMITQEGVDKARAFRIGLDNLDDSLMAVKLSIAQALMPVVNILAGAFTFLVSSVRSLLNIFPPLGSAVTIVVGTFGALAATVGPVLLMLPKLLDIKMKISAALPVLNARLMTVGATVKSLSLTFFGIVLAAEAVAFAFKKIHAAQDAAMASIKESASESVKGWKFAQASIRGATDVAAADMKRIIASQKSMGHSAEEIGETIYKMFRMKIGTAMKSIAKDASDMAEKVKEVQRDLTDKIKETTLNEFDYRIWQAARWRDDMKEKVKGSVEEVRLAAEADKAYALEVRKIRKEQLEAQTKDEGKYFQTVESWIDDLKKKWKMVDDAIDKGNSKLQISMQGDWRKTKEHIGNFFTAMVQNSDTGLVKVKTGTKKTLSDVATSVGQYLQIMQQGFGQFFSSFGQLAEANLKRNLARLDTEHEARKKWIMENVSDVVERDKQLAALDEETAKKKRQLEYDAAKKKRDLDIFSAITNAAVAITASWKLGWPLGAIAAAFSAIACAIQIKAIKAAQLPALAEGGVAMKPTHALIGEAGPEAVIPLREWARMMGIKKSGMGGQTNYNFYPQAFDATSMDRVFSKSIIPRMKRSLARESLTVAPNAVR